MVTSREDDQVDVLGHDHPRQQRHIAVPCHRDAQVVNESLFDALVVEQSQPPVAGKGEVPRRARDVASSHELARTIGHAARLTEKVAVGLVEEHGTEYRTVAPGRLDKEFAMHSTLSRQPGTSRRFSGRQPAPLKRQSAIARAAVIVGLVVFTASILGCSKKKDYKDVALETLQQRVQNLGDSNLSAKERYLLERYEVAIKEIGKNSDVALPVSAVLYMRSMTTGRLSLEWIEEKASIKGFRLVRGTALLASADNSFVWTPADHDWFRNAGLLDTWIPITSDETRLGSVDGEARWTTASMGTADFSDLTVQLVLDGGQTSAPIPLFVDWSKAAASKSALPSTQSAAG